MSETLKRITDRVTAYPCGEGTFLHDAFAPVAVELDYLFNVIMPAATDALMPDTAVGEHLDRLAAAYAIVRILAAPATGTVTFTGAVGSEILQYTPVSTADGRLYLVDETGAIPAGGVLDLAVTAALDGAAGDADAAAVILLPTPIAGVTAVTNALAIGGGADLEGDEGLRARLQLRLSAPSASGTALDYVRWALETAGVGDAHCIALWAGAGTVKVVISDTDGGVADAQTVADCAAYIETVRPIGADVTVVSVTAVTVNVAADITPDTGFTVPDLQTPIEEALAAFLADYGFGTTSLSYARLGAAILDVEGVGDYSALTINSAAANLAITAENVLALGTVTLT